MLSAAFPTEILIHSIDRQFPPPHFGSFAKSHGHLDGSPERLNVRPVKREAGGASIEQIAGCRVDNRVCEAPVRCTIGTVP